MHQNRAWFCVTRFCRPAAGTTLITVGEYQRKLGGAEREFLHTAAVTFLSPLRNFLEGDWRTISVSWTACGSDPVRFLSSVLL